MEKEKAQHPNTVAVQELPQQLEGPLTKQNVVSIMAYIKMECAHLVSQLGSTGPRPYFQRFLYAFVPQILRTKIWNDTIPASKIGPTSWMDGFRGIAAVVVLNYHFFFAFSNTASLGWGATEEDRWLIQLPFLHLVTDGATCVIVFFTVAGYVCSVKTLQLMSENKLEKALQSLSASVFRRFFRLYLPVVCITFMWTVMAYVGCFDMVRPMIEDRKTYFPGPFSEVSLKRFPSLSGQINYWLSDLFKLSNVWWVGPVYADHDQHLWTIAYEYRTSMHLYVALVGLALCKPYVRIFWLCVLAMIYLYWNRWEGPLFFLGAAMAQFDIIQKSQQTLPVSRKDFTAKIIGGKDGFRMRIARLIGYAVALYLMSFPIGGNKRPDPFYAWVNQFIPAWYKRKDKFPKTVGTLLFFFMATTSRNTTGTPNPSIVHRLFTTPFAQYCGKIMFGLYLVHGKILHMVGYGFPHWIWALVGNDTVSRYIFGLIMGWLMSILICFWAADVFTREVDARCANLIKRVESWCFSKR